MKAWYDDIDAATLQRIKTYSAFNDAKSKNLMMQTMYEYREKEIQDFKETNHELAETCIARKKRIAELEKENAELKSRLKWYSEQICNKECAEVWGELTKAIELISKLSWLKHRADAPFTCDEYTKLIKEAEQFLKEVSE